VIRLSWPCSLPSIIGIYPNTASRINRPRKRKSALAHSKRRAAVNNENAKDLRHRSISTSGTFLEGTVFFALHRQLLASKHAPSVASKLSQTQHQPLHLFHCLHPTMPVTTRNNGRSPSPSPTRDSRIEFESTPTRHASRPSPYLLLSYLLILGVGSLYSIISPAASSSFSPAPLAPGISSDVNTPIAPAPVNYFASKRNILNLYFVKIGWFWTTLAFVLLQITSRPSTSNPKQSHYIQSATRYALVTLSWIFTTQWLFGPALIDRSFTITGGHCEARPESDHKSFNANIDISIIMTSPACKAAGGRWRGGHDISGHVFMLVLSSAFLLFELYLADRHSAHPSVSPHAAAGVAAGMTEEEKRSVGGWESETLAQVRIYSRYLVWTVVSLDFWMLLMTAIWFHTWPEKLSGLILSATSVWCIYFLPDFIPLWRGIVGGF
jgi:Inositol phospholipid synthesis and fat-storage-inducing TM